jgi:hypothetical protein
MSEPNPKPEPVQVDWSKWATPVSVLLLGAVLLWQQVRGPVVPTPVPVPPAPIIVPVKVDPSDAIVERDGVRLDAEKTKLFCEVVNAGDGQFTVSYQPVGKKRVTRTIVVSGDVVPPVVTPDKPDVPKPPVVDPTTKPTAATYVYEKDQGGVPSAVMSGLNRLNREKKVLATVFERDSTDGSEVPEQYKIPLAEANKAGLPALVITSGSTVLKVIKAPKTEAEIVEAVN